MRIFICALLMFALAGCAPAVVADPCEGNHRPVAVIEVTQ